MEKKVEDIRNEYIDINYQYTELYLKLNAVNLELREVLDKITDQEELKKIIDFIFSDKVEEVHEYAIRKLYLK